MIASKVFVKQLLVEYSQNKYLPKQKGWSPFKVKLCENTKNSYFPQHALHASLPFVLRVSFIFLQGYRKIWIIMVEKLWRIEIVYFLPSCLWDLNYNTYSLAEKVCDIKGIVKSAEPCKCVILLVSTILWHKRINPSLKGQRFWYLILTSHLPL